MRSTSIELERLLRKRVRDVLDAGRQHVAGRLHRRRSKSCCAMTSVGASASVGSAAALTAAATVSDGRSIRRCAGRVVRQRQADGIGHAAQLGARRLHRLSHVSRRHAQRQRRSRRPSFCHGLRRRRAARASRPRPISLQPRASQRVRSAPAVNAPRRRLAFGRAHALLQALRQPPRAGDADAQLSRIRRRARAARLAARIGAALRRELRAARSSSRIAQRLLGQVELGEQPAQVVQQRTQVRLLGVAASARSARWPVVPPSARTETAPSVAPRAACPSCGPAAPATTPCCARPQSRPARWRARRSRWCRRRHAGTTRC